MSDLPQERNGVALRAENLSRSVGTKVLLANASFAVECGELLAIVGPSGSGKSTLLRLLNRLDEPTTGTVFLDAVDYRELLPPELRRRVGMVTQRPFLFPGSVASNLQFGPQQRGETLSESDVEGLLISVGLAGYGSRDVANLSGGEAQRVSFARTLANRPEILLLDEPTSALDEDSKLGIESLMTEIMQRPAEPTSAGEPICRKLTCLLVTHDLAQAERLAKRALVLNSGRIVKDGPIAEVLNVKDAFS